MSVVDSIRKFVVPVHPEGYLFIVAAVLLALFVHWLVPAVGWLFWFCRLSSPIFSGIHRESRQRGTGWFSRRQMAA